MYIYIYIYIYVYIYTYEYIMSKHALASTGEAPLGQFCMISWESWESLGVPRASLGRPLGSSGRPWRPWERPGIVLGAPGAILELLVDPCLRPVRANC